MSMICWVLGLSPAQIGALRAQPELAGEMADVSSDRWYRACRDEAASNMAPEEASARLAQFGPSRMSFA
jgi:hypothetical protein